MSQFPPEGAVLEGGEEGVMLGQGGALRLLQLVHRPHPAGEFLLEGDGGEWNANCEINWGPNVDLSASNCILPQHMPEVFIVGQVNEVFGQDTLSVHPEAIGSLR